jgi:hypothetical protein
MPSPSPADQVPDGPALPDWCRPGARAYLRSTQGLAQDERSTARVERITKRDVHVLVGRAERPEVVRRDGLVRHLPGHFSGSVSLYPWGDPEAAAGWQRCADWRLVMSARQSCDRIFREGARSVALTVAQREALRHAVRSLLPSTVSEES